MRYSTWQRSKVRDATWQRQRVEEILTILEAAETIEEANIPGYRLHPLTGNLKGLWSVRVTGNW
ncbi:type II toxin-antitoxin system RelE/ParE family toxin [Nitrosospira multiformis]|uniref:type II toxin-antitoxin system RelE/ParE family toxin n=1 Tax=Nitrosospira multiformis TaxID=1231 RepID=UPI0015A54BA0|nr:type II toxin-antitoxin system RelE/ParE family toxin [Nitrosospira multiformis]